MSKIQKINVCIDCNDYVSCDLAGKEIPDNCPLKDSDWWKKELFEWIDKELTNIPRIVIKTSAVELLSRKNTLNELKQKIQDM